MNDHRCPKCSTAMEEGFFLDRSHHDYGKPTDWVEGEPAHSFWTGTKTRGRTRHRIESWRCPRCGFVELYAPADGE